MIRIIFVLCVMFLIFLACNSGKDSGMDFTGAPNEVKLMILDPGHFHAALVQKNMFKNIDPVVHVYAPDGPDVEDYVNRINNFNTRAENSTAWQLDIYRGDDFLAKMLADKPGNVMVMAGNNRHKTHYLKEAVDAGFNVLADKPMCINKEGFALLQQVFQSAQEHGVLLYDIMTERHEITTMLQKELSRMPEVFGELLPGTPEEPAVTKESVHHFFKYVSGKPLTRPAWYFDTTQQGEGIVDVATHLVDLVQWECFPEQTLDFATDIKMVKARRWATEVSREQFARVTGLAEYPEFLAPYVQDDILSVYANGEFVYKLKGVHAKVSVIWNYQAPEGAGDTHFSIMRGSEANVVIRQGAEQNYKPELYIEPVAADANFGATVESAIVTVAEKFPGVSVEQQGDVWHVIIPQEYHVGHEAHFGQVADKYLQYLIDGKLPDWEVPNMLAKYYTTTSALEMALQ